jgi:DNA-binding transcriptional LysR family regulator
VPRPASRLGWQAASQAQRASGKLRATVVSPVATEYWIPLPPQFQVRHPEFELELELSKDASPLIPKPLDVGIRMGALNDASFVARPLGPLRLLLCAAPSYLAQNSAPTHVEQLHAHRVLMLQITGREQTTPLMPDTMLEGLQLFIHYPSRKQLPARVRAFVDFVVEHFAGHPDLSKDVSAFAAA